MDLSVVIPTYNRSIILSNTLHSLTSQICDLHFEVFVCDDGSNDDTPEMIQTYLDKTTFSLRYLRQERTGARYSTARNLGISAACGRIVILLDDDMILPDSFLKTHYETHEYSHVVTIGYRYNLVPGAPEGCLPDTRDKLFSAYPNIEKPMWSIMETCNVSLERDLLLRAGMFDETFMGWGGEDIELGYRLHRLGAKLILKREAFAWHQYDPNPKNSFLRYHRGLKPDFSSQIANLTRFKNKYPEDLELQELLTSWILRLRKTELEMLDFKN